MVTAILVMFALIVYAISAYGCCAIFIDKRVDLSFVPIMIMILPLVNMIYAIVYSKKSDIKKIFEK